MKRKASPGKASPAKASHTRLPKGHPSFNLPSPSGGDFSGAQSDSIKGYKLPVCDVDEEKRNFPGYKETQPYSLEDLKVGQSNVVSTETKGGTEKN